jgi:hypothetical protein
MLSSIDIRLPAFLGFIKNINFSNRRHFWTYNNPKFVATVVYLDYTFNKI